MANPSSHCWRSRKSLAAGRKSSGGSAPSSPPKAPERSRARVPAPSPLPETSTTTTSSRSRSGGPAVTTKSPANGVPPAERRAASAWKPDGQRRDGALALDAVAQVDQHRLAPDARDAEPAAPERGQQDDEAGDEQHDDATDEPRRDVGQLRHRPDDAQQDEHDEPRKVPRAEGQAAQDQRQHERGDRDVLGPDPGRDRQRQGQRHQRQQGPVALGRAAAQRGVGRAAEAWSPDRTPLLGAHVGGHCTARERNFG